MATLNTLRTRGGVIVAIVIGIALVAFLLGDLAGTGSLLNARKMRVGSIDGTNIGYMEYAAEAERYTTIAQMLSGNEALSTEEQDDARNMAWDNMVMEIVYQPGLAKLGLTPGEAEQIDMTSGVYLSPVIAGMFANPNTGLFDPAYLKNFIDNVDLDESGRVGTLWSYIKAQMNYERSLSKYFNLLEKGNMVTDIEVNQALRLANSSYDATIVTAPYTSIADSLVTVKESEIKAFYNANRNLFRQNPSRTIEYVAFNALPSEDDYADAAKFIDEVAAEFAQSETPMQYATLNSHDKPDSRFLRESQIEGTIAAALWNKPNAMYGPVLNGDTYVVARLAETRKLPDSIGAKHILLPANEMQKADSLVKVLKSGGNFGELAREYSYDPSAAQNGGDLGRFSPDQMIAEFSDAVIAANRGDIIKVNTAYGLHIVEVTYKSAPVEKAQIAKITYKVEPSSRTQQIVYAEANNFYTNAAGSYENFQKAVTESALSKRTASIRNTDRTVSGIADSREIVRWAFNAEAKDVSSILDAGGDYIVAAVTSANDDAFAPVSQVADQIRGRLMTEKKAEMLMAQMNGSSLSDVAAATGGTEKQAEGVNFASFYIDGVGVEPRLIGAIASDPDKAVAGPVKGYSGVHVFTVTNKTETGDATAESEKVRLEAAAESRVSDRANMAVRENSDIVDKRVKFF